MYIHNLKLINYFIFLRLCKYIINQYLNLQLNSEQKIKIAIVKLKFIIIFYLTLQYYNNVAFR